VTKAGTDLKLAPWASWVVALPLTRASPLISLPRLPADDFSSCARPIRSSRSFSTVRPKPKGFLLPTYARWCFLELAAVSFPMNEVQETGLVGPRRGLITPRDGVESQAGVLGLELLGSGDPGGVEGGQDDKHGRDGQVIEGKLQLRLDVDGARGHPPRRHRVSRPRSRPF